MSAIHAYNTHTHVVDTLGNVKGRDQPIMLMAKAIELVTTLDESVFLDDDVVFFDPFCKAGEILLACAFSSCHAKYKSITTAFHSDAFKHEVQKELYHSNRYFALAPDERHHRLSLRTFLGNEHSHDEQFNHIIRNGNYVSEIDGKLNREKFEQEFASMLEYIKTTSGKKQIIAVGNPPYQESDGGFGKSAKSIYNFFAEQLADSPDISEFVLVIPARWFGGGKGLNGFRKRMMTSAKIKNLKYFKKSSEVFPTVDINGGICFLHYDKEHNDKTNFTGGKHSENIDFSEYDIIPDDPLAFSLIRKIQFRWKGKSVGDVAWSSKPFGLRTNYFDKNKDLGADSFNGVPCLSRGKLIKYASKDQITKNVEKIELWKVSAPKAAGGSKGKRRSTVPLNQIFLVDKGTITTETYNIIEVFNQKNQAENFVSFLKTDFARYLVGLRKITQDLPPDRWNWVPYMDVSRKWTDENLFEYFDITPEEQQHIKNKVKEWS